MISNAAKCYIILISLSILYNYLINDPMKLFSDLYLANKGFRKIIFSMIFLYCIQIRILLSVELLKFYYMPEVE